MTCIKKKLKYRRIGCLLDRQVCTVPRLAPATNPLSQLRRKKNLLKQVNYLLYPWYNQLMKNITCLCLSYLHVGCLVGRVCRATGADYHWALPFIPWANLLHGHGHGQSRPTLVSRRAWSEVWMWVLARPTTVNGSFSVDGLSTFTIDTLGHAMC